MTFTWRKRLQGAKAQVDGGDIEIVAEFENPFQAQDRNAIGYQYARFVGFLFFVFIIRAILGLKLREDLYRDEAGISGDAPKNPALCRRLFRRRGFHESSRASRGPNRAGPSRRWWTGKRRLDRVILHRLHPSSRPPTRPCLAERDGPCPLRYPGWQWSDPSR